MSWEIKGKDNTTKFVVEKIEHNDEWMQERYVTVTVESPCPIDFAIGDYIIYRDERFEINYDPGKIKSAPRFTKGDAFKYENVKFNSLADELTRCDFLDVVPGDNQLHFTGLPKFSFYGGVKSLADRIQANLDRAYGKDVWCVVVDTDFSSDTELNVSVDTIKVSGALEILVNQFKTYYTIKGRTLTIGAAGVPADHLFKYGPGQGLYEIEENAEADQQIVTRLRAYGSTRNIPHRYYNSLTDADGVKLIPDNMAVQYLMLPEFPYTTQDPYIDSPNIDALGVREGTIFFDGSGELEEIYPSIEGMTAEQLIAAGVTCNATGELDVLVGAEQMTDNGVGKIEGDAFEGNATTEAEPATFKVTIKDVGFDINDHIIEGNSESPTVSFKTGMLGGRDFEIVKCTPLKSGNTTTGYELELNRVYDEDIKLWFPYKDYNAKANDKFVLLNIKMPVVYIKAASQRLLEAAEKWLAKNDYSRSIYAPKIDENFMARQHDAAMTSGGTIKSLHDTLTAGMQLLFEDEDLGIDAAVFIDRLTIIEGEGPIPTYEVVLKEEKTVGRLDKMQNQIDSLAAGQGQGSGGYSASQIRSLINAYGGQMFLSKLKDDRSAGKVSSDKGFEVGDFVAGAQGAMVGKDAATGKTFAEVDYLYARVKAYFESLTIIEANTLAGKQYITPGGSVKCTDVEEVMDEDGNVTAYRCYFLSEQDGEKTDTKIIAGDQAISEMFNAKEGTANKVSNHRWWRLVTAVDNDAYTDDNGNHYGYIEVSASDCESGSDIPQEGDVIAQLGNREDATRQSAMVFSTVDPDAPSIKMYSGINSYSLNDKAIISFGRDPLNNQVYFRLGNSTATQYLNYTQQDGLVVAGSITTDSTIDGKSVDDYIREIAPEFDDDELRVLIGYAQGAADNAQDSADKAQADASDAAQAASDAQDTADTASTLASSAYSKATAAEALADSYKYLKDSLGKALADSTHISGGLILTTMIELGYTEGEARHILSGMNGSYNATLGGRTPAAWYGGNMIDRFDPLGLPYVTPPANAAASMIRMDGSVYFGGGAHAFNPDGTGWLGNYDNGIKFDALGRITVGSGVTININDEDKGLKETLESVIAFQLGFENLLTPCDANNNPISWGEATQSDGAGGIRAKSLKASVGFWSEGFISARGINAQSSVGSVGASTLADLTDVLLGSDLAAGQSLVYNGTEWVNQAVALDLTPYALKTELVSSEERTLWNNTATDLAAIMGADGDGTLNKWNEITAFLATYTEADTLANLLGNKVSKAGDTMTGTLKITGGYLDLGGNYLTGMTDGGFQFMADGTVTMEMSKVALCPNGTKYLGSDAKRWANVYVTKADVSDRIKIGGGEIIWDAENGGFHFTKGIYSDEWISARGANPNAGGASGGLDEDSLAQYLSDNGYVTSAALGGYVTLDTPQTILAAKTFTAGLSVSGRAYGGGDDEGIVVGKASNGYAGVCLGVPNGLRSVFYLTDTDSPVWRYHDGTSTTDITHPKTSGVIATREWVGAQGYATTSWVENKGYLTSLPTHTHSYLPLSGGTMSNSNLVTNLNADLLDGVHNGEVTAKLLTTYENHRNSDSLITAPKDLLKGIIVQFRNATGAASSIIWNTVVSLNAFSGASNSGAGYRHQFLFNDNQNEAHFYVRNGVDDTWNAWNKVAFTTDIPTKVSQLTNDSGYVLSSSLANYVDKTSAQEISGGKIFTSSITQFRDDTRGLFIYSNLRGKAGAIEIAGANGTWAANCMEFENNGDVTFRKKIIKTGGTSSQFLKADGSVDSNSYALASSLGSYLPLSGGTLTGNLTINASAANLQLGNFASWAGSNYPTIKSSSADKWVMMFNPHICHDNMGSLNAAVIRMGCDATATNWWDVRAGNGDNSFMIYRGNASNKSIAGVKITDSAMYLNGNTIWHSGNDGAGSGLDADLLDGYHSYNFDVVRQATIDLSDLDPNTWYPVLFTLVVGAISNLSVKEATRAVWGTNSAAVNGKRIFWCTAHWQSSGNGWGAITLTRYIYQIKSNWHEGSSPIGEIGQLNNSSNEYIYLRGGAAYQCRATNCTNIFPVTASTTISTQTIAPKSASASAARNSALVSDNVASATKLATTRYLWGQPFNGEGDVSGNMTGVGSITASGTIKSTAQQGFLSEVGTGVWSYMRYKSNTTLWDIAIKDNDLSGALQFRYGGADANRVYITTGGTLYAPKGQFNTSTSTYALNAASFICDSWIRTTGATGWYSETYGGGWYMGDTNYIKNYGSKRIKIEGISDYYGIWLEGSGFCCEGYWGSSWNSGHGGLNVGCTNNNNQTPLMVAYRASGGLTGANRLFAMELLNSGATLRFCFGGAYKFHMASDGVFYASTGIYSDGYVSARGQNTSDIRLKTDIRGFNATDIIRSLRPVAFRWNAEARSRFEVFRTDEVQYGLIAQEAVRVAPWLVDRNMFGDGLWGVKYEKLIPILTQGVKEVVFTVDDLTVRVKNQESRVKNQESRVKDLERENEELKRKIEILERR